MAVWLLPTEWYPGRWPGTLHDFVGFDPGPTKTRSPLILVTHHGKPGHLWSWFSMIKKVVPWHEILYSGTLESGEYQNTLWPISMILEWYKYSLSSRKPVPWRCVCLLLLLLACGAAWFLEQPHSSLLSRHDRFRWMVKTLQNLGIRVAQQSLQRNWILNRICYFPKETIIPCRLLRGVLGPMFTYDL